MRDILPRLRPEGTTKSASLVGKADQGGNRSQSPTAKGSKEPQGLSTASIEKRLARIEFATRTQRLLNESVKRQTELETRVSALIDENAYLRQRIDTAETRLFYLEERQRESDRATRVRL